jgi:hypothetical protein
MLKHIVMWKFKDAADGAGKQENLHKAKVLLDSLPDKISAIGEFEVGIDTLRSDASFDLVLNSSFADHRRLTAYQTHPEHVKVVEFLRKVQVSKVVVDYEV